MVKFCIHKKPRFNDNIINPIIIFNNLNKLEEILEEE